MNESHTEKTIEQGGQHQNRFHKRAFGNTLVAALNYRRALAPSLLCFFKPRLIRLAQLLHDLNNRAKAITQLT